MHRSRCRRRALQLAPERSVTSAAAGRPVVLLHGCGGSFAAAFETTGWLDALRAAGRTPLKIFDKEKSDPVLLQPGDEIQFYSISEDEFKNY